MTDPPPCLNPDEAALWYDAERRYRSFGNQRVRRSQEMSSPCHDCTVAFATEMRALVPSRCNGRYPGEDGYVEPRSRWWSYGTEEERTEARRRSQRESWHRRVARQQAVRAEGVAT
jgi:hypothetical protein